MTQYDIYSYYMHWGLPYTRQKLESMKLHEVVPQAPLQRSPSLAERLLQRRAYMR
jgi:hypothetical protein